MIIHSSNARFGLLWTAPQAEERACADLERHGFEAYLPLARHYRKASRHQKAKGVIEVRVPVFPRYLFVGADHAEWLRIKSCIGIAAIVAVRGQPILIDRRSIEDVMSAEDMGVFDDPEPGRRAEVARIRIGEAIELVSGAFVGYRGEVVGIPRGRGETVRVEIGGLPMTVPLDHVQRLA